jgi:hypothetical protein
VTFITYSSTGHDLDPAIIFPALQFFDIIAGTLRVMPLMLTNMLDCVLSMSELHVDHFLMLLLTNRAREDDAGGE